LSTPATPSLGPACRLRRPCGVDLLERGHSTRSGHLVLPAGHRPRHQGHYLCGRRELDDLGFTITLVSFSDSLAARETRRRCTAVASFG
jgi:hypothetical protein